VRYNNKFPVCGFENEDKEKKYQFTNTLAGEKNGMCYMDRIHLTAMIKEKP
jgi:hypothetical protein